MGKYIAPLMAALIAVLVYVSPAGTLLNNWGVDLRMAATSVPASGDILFVAIDARSLQEVGTWPWSRSIHADILDQLMAAGARDVLFDIDFAFASDPEGDAQFSAALDRAGGGTYLAAFAQSERFGRGTELTYNLPYEPFAEVSWPAAVNVVSDRDGLIRTYLSGTRIEGSFVPSAAVLFAGGVIAEGTQFEINYSIPPRDIPSLSAVDVAQGNFAASDIRGRSVIVGAAAVELGDHFAVPLHQVIPGALVHAVAAETLMQGASILRARADLMSIGLAIVILILTYFRPQNPWRLVNVTALIAFAIEGAALTLFQVTSISLPTAFVHPALLMFVLANLSRSLNFSTLLLRRKDLQIENTQALLNHLFEQSSDGIIIVDDQGRPLMHSRSAQQMFGTDDRSGLRMPPEFLQSVGDKTPAPDVASTAPMVQSLALDGKNGRRHIEYLATPSVFQHLAGRNGETCAQRITAIAARDVTDLKHQEREIAYLSTHDERTGALRRRPFLEFLRLRLASDEPTAVFVLNLQRFKTINQTLGRDIGDAVLAEVVARLQSINVGLSAIARLDGDSFAFFVEQFSRECDVAALANTIKDRVCTPYVFPDASAQIGASIGYVKVVSGSAVSPEGALSCAEDALDVARTWDKSRIFEYDPAVAKQRERIRDVECAMPGAIERGELYVEYQPQNRLTDGALIGVEALVRWKHPELGQVFPDEFIPIAESNGFINDLGRFVLRQAARDALDLPQEVSVAVNVSSIQFQLGDLQHDVSQALAETGLVPERLCLELTESVVLSQDVATIEMMHDIAWTGVTWAMDDFGTGFSSMAYLSQLPLSKIKLDRFFTMALDHDPTALGILRSVVVLCKGLGLGLLCEGIETEDHLRILLEEGCVEGQGYHFGRPQAICDIVQGIGGGTVLTSTGVA